jgi:hypothetical protein
VPLLQSVISFSARAYPCTTGPTVPGTVLAQGAGTYNYTVRGTGTGTWYHNEKSTQEWYFSTRVEPVSYLPGTYLDGTVGPTVAYVSRHATIAL